MENETVTIELEEQPASMFDMLQGSGMEQMGMNLQDSLNQMMPKKSKNSKTTVKEARKLLTQEETRKLVDMDEAQQETVYLTEQSCIIFIDEIDKVVGQDQSANVSREDVQRDILPRSEEHTSALQSRGHLVC